LPIPGPGPSTAPPPPRIADSQADAATPPVLVAGWLSWDGRALRLAPCDGSAARDVLDVSPENSVTAALTDLGLERSRLYVEIFARPAGAGLHLFRLNRATAEGGCAPRPAAAWRATGNEPFWSVTVASGGLLTLSRPGEPDVALKAEPASASASGAGLAGQTLRWAGTGPDGQLFSLELLPRLCRDTMADAMFGWRAEWRRGNRTDRGCAWQGPGGPGL